MKYKGTGAVETVMSCGEKLHTLKWIGTEFEEIFNKSDNIGVLGTNHVSGLLLWLDNVAY